MLNIIKAKDLQLPDSPYEWLKQLQQPTVIEIEGKDSSQWRVISVLIHGNEPSGFFATYQFLKQQITPHTNLAISISSVRAARQIPAFSHRHVPGEFDLNRRFGLIESNDRVTELARQLTEYIRGRCPQLIVDLHNTSGSGPAFAVSISNHHSIRKMASLFCHRMVVTQLIVGSLMELNFNCPIVTIECGGSQDEESHKVALEGLNAFSKIVSIDELDENIMEIFAHPVRVTAHQGISLKYGEQENADVDITLIKDIEHLNFDEITTGKQVAWLSRSLGDCLQAINDQGEDVIESLFEVINNQLIAKRNLRIFMATSRADIALSDCLFYAVEV